MFSRESGFIFQLNRSLMLQYYKTIISYLRLLFPFQKGGNTFPC